MDSDLAVLAVGDVSAGHRTLAEKAFATLHAAIVTGRLRPGARLPIEELAQHLQMSPMPIREAVRRLDSAGLVENIPHRGARVTQLSIEDLSEVYDARLALETLAVRRAAERFTPHRAERARAYLTELQAKSGGDARETSTIHERFHFSLYESAESGWLLRLIRPVWETSERYCLEQPECRRLDERAPEHEEILAACEAGDPVAASKALYRHLATTANNLAAAMGGSALYRTDGD